MKNETDADFLVKMIQKQLKAIDELTTQLHVYSDDEPEDCVARLKEIANQLGRILKKNGE